MAPKRISYGEFMPEIIFDVLVSAPELDALAARVHRLADAMSLTSQTTASPVVDAATITQLKEQLEGDSSDAVMTRYIIQAETNLNQTAMTFARLFTPHADLPMEPALLEAEELYEVAAIYPWIVQIQP